ncbi:MAG: hypothetical protein V4622_13810 [Bacteroidota bacterium]
MKKIALRRGGILLTFILLSFTSFSQLIESDGIFHFKVDSANYQNFSLGAEWLVHERIGLNYNFDFVHRDDKLYHLHSSAGLVAGPPLIGLGIISYLVNGNLAEDGNLGGLGIVGGLLLLILPEGVSYHLPIKYNYDLSAYANVLGVDFVKNNKPGVDKGYLRYAPTFGAKFSYWNPKNFTIFSFVETRKTAAMGWSLGAGLGFGKTF